MPVLLLAAGMYLALAIVFKILAKILGLKEERERAFQVVFVFGNIGFIGIPLIQTLYQGEGMIYVALFSIVDQLTLWTYGIYLTDNHSKKMNPKNFVNPAVVAVILAIACILTGIQLPNVIENTLFTVGRASTATCMIYLGALFYFYFESCFKRKRTLYWNFDKNDNISDLLWRSIKIFPDCI